RLEQFELLERFELFMKGKELYGQENSYLLPGAESCAVVEGDGGGRIFAEARAGNGNGLAGGTTQARGGRIEGGRSRRRFGQPPQFVRSQGAVWRSLCAHRAEQQCVARKFSGVRQGCQRLAGFKRQAGRDG